jgi:hypothetical protein
MLLPHGSHPILFVSQGLHFQIQGIPEPVQLTSRMSGTKRDLGAQSSHPMGIIGVLIVTIVATFAEAISQTF